MKKLIIPLLFICVLSNAQSWKRPVAITLYQIGTVALGSIGDGLNDEGYKTAGHVLKAAEVAALVSGPFIFKLGKRDYAPYIATYLGWRIVGYDYLYNATRGLEWDYLGESNLWDKTFRQFPPHGVTFMRGVVLMVTISIPIKYF